MLVWFIFFNDTATTEIYTLSLHDALPISAAGATFQDVAKVTIYLIDPRYRDALREIQGRYFGDALPASTLIVPAALADPARSEEHTSELQSRQYLVCRLLLEKKKKIIRMT